MKSIVVCKLPNAGLGNQLFPLMKAHVFAHINGLPIVVTNYRQIKIGPWLRNEKHKRYYRGDFIFEKNRIMALFAKRKIRKKLIGVLESEPPIKKIERDKTSSYIFTAIPHWDNLFAGLRENRELTIQLFWKLLRPEIKEKLATLSNPCIGIHVRMGDFRKLKENEDFRMVGAVRTPESYFIDMIEKIRGIHGSTLPVSVFTDGYKKELNQLFSLENIQIVEGNNDLVDLLLLSRSKIIVTSAGSTFSYWSGFLSNAIVIMHPDHIHESIRPLDCNMFEGPFDENNTQLTQLVRSIEI